MQDEAQLDRLLEKAALTAAALRAMREAIKEGAEIGREEPYPFPRRRAAKSSTSVAIYESSARGKR